jgi:hypothetical protein
VAKTGLAVLKFETRAHELDFDPLDPVYEYAAQVQDGLNFIMPFAQTQPIGVQPAGDPDGDGDGNGVYFEEPFCGHVIYNTGIALMALSASGHPELYGDTVQDVVDYLAWSQADPECSPPDVHRGGWRYNPNQCSSDNSNSGYVTLGLGYAQAGPPFGFGVTVPQFVKDELSIWIDVIQDDVNGDADDGGSWYDPGNPWVNILKTGNLIYEMGLVGDDPETTRVMAAIDYIERHWGDAGGPSIYDTGWLNHRQAMFTMMKGFESLGIELLDLDDDSVPETDWYAVVAEHLLDTQNVDGSWPIEPWHLWGADQGCSTAWALLTLERAVPEFQIDVPFDIKPTSCPNPLNVKEKGVLPVAILGTEDFDVTRIDPASVRLFRPVVEGEPTLIAPLRWSLEDVATPYEPFVEKPLDIYACTEDGPDGFMDLTLKFSAPEVSAELGSAEDGEAVRFIATGNLKEEHGGTPFVGEDIVRMLVKKDKTAETAGVEVLPTEQSRIYLPVVTRQR